MEEIMVKITPQGDVKVSVKGVKGKSCKDMTKALEAAFGDVQSSATTSEYLEAPVAAKVKVHQ
jgi:hypothetical protein